MSAIEKNLPGLMIEAVQAVVLQHRQGVYSSVRQGEGTWFVKPNWQLSSSDCVGFVQRNEILDQMSRLVVEASGWSLRPSQSLNSTSNVNRYEPSCDQVAFACLRSVNFGLN